MQFICSRYRLIFQFSEATKTVLALVDFSMFDFSVFSVSKKLSRNFVSMKNRDVHKLATCFIFSKKTNYNCKILK